MSHANAALTPRHRLKVAHLARTDGPSARSRPLSSFMAHREEMGRPLSRWRTHDGSAGLSGLVSERRRHSGVE